MAALGKYKTEIIGISAEVAIADEFGVSVTPEYRQRADADIIAMTRKVVPEVKTESGLRKSVAWLKKRDKL